MTAPLKSSDLPRLLRLVAEDCGMEAAFTLVAALGGERVYVPAASEGSLLERRAGSAAAAALARRFGGEYVVVPHLSDRLRAARREAYAAAHPEAAADELVRALGMSRRGVQLLRQRLRERQAGRSDPRQLDLFGEE